MTVIDDGQALAITNGEADLAATNSALASTVVPIPPQSISAAVTVVSGTAKQISASKNATLYVNITTAAALAITMGATSTGTGTTISASQSSALGVMTITVPRGWYIKFTGTVTNYSIVSIIE